MALKDMRESTFATKIGVYDSRYEIPKPTTVRLSDKGRLSFDGVTDLDAYLAERLPSVAYALLAGEKPPRDRVAEVTYSWRQVVTGQDYAQGNGVEGGLPPSMRKLAKSKAVIHHLRALDRGEKLTTKQKQQIRGFISSAVDVALFVGRYSVPEEMPVFYQNRQRANKSTPKNFFYTRCRVLMDETAAHNLISTVDQTPYGTYERVTLHATVTPRWFRQVYLRGLENIGGYCVMDILDRDTALVVDQRMTQHDGGWYVDGKHFFLRKQRIPNIGEGLFA